MVNPQYEFGETVKYTILSMIAATGLVLAPGAQAQGYNPFEIGASGGIAFPTGDLGTTTKALSGDDANLVGLLTAAERLAGRFSGREGEITSLLAQSARTMASRAAGGTRLSGVSPDQSHRLKS